MKSTERHTIKPVGLARFLVSHGECAEGFETIRDQRVITVICRGCDASFSFLGSSSSDSSKGVEAALVELAEASGPDLPSSNGSNGATPGHVPAQHQRPIHTPPALGSAKRLPPPGPLAPRRQRHTVWERLGPPLEEAGRRFMGTVDRRRRSIALATLALAGAYVLIALTVGGEQSSSQGNGALGGPQVPVSGTQSAPSAPDQGAAAAARPMRSFQAGGPALQDVGGDEAQFSVALPPDWGNTVGVDGRTLLGPSAGGAEIQVIARPRGSLGISQMADEGTAFLRQSLPPGHAVERLPAQPIGNLLSVARASTDSGARVAYIELGDTVGYLVVEHVRKDASALVRLEVQGVISSFAAG